MQTWFKDFPNLERKGQWRIFLMHSTETNFSWTLIALKNYWIRVRKPVLRENCSICKRKSRMLKLKDKIIIWSWKMKTLNLKMMKTQRKIMKIFTLSFRRIPWKKSIFIVRIKWSLNIINKPSLYSLLPKLAKDRKTCSNHFKLVIGKIRVCEISS